MFEMNDEQSNSEFDAKVYQQPQQGDRIGAPRDRYADAITRRQQPQVANRLKNTLFECSH